MARAISSNTRLVFISTPNNPTGMICLRQEVSSFMSVLPKGVVVVFDESYRDFVSDADYPDPTEYIAEGRDVIVLRSFSKAAGLANLRVGYAISNPEIIHYLLHAQLPFNTGGPALVAALASLDDGDYVARSRNLMEEQRAFLYEGLASLGVRTVASHTNFILLTDLPLEATAFSELLIYQGVIVRPMNAWGLDRAVRVSLGQREDNHRFLQAMQVVLEGVRARSPAG
jgi:histidinol-phosphate aminotransferase